MIEIKIDLEIKYKEPDVNEYFFKERHPYSTFETVEQFCQKLNFIYDKVNNTIVKKIDNKIIKFNNLMECFTNIETVLKEEYDEKYSHGIYLKEIKYKINSITGVIQEYDLFY